MRANQAIYRVGGGVEVFRTEMRFHFYDVGYEWGGSYWKVHDPLSMEIWSLDERRQPRPAGAQGPEGLLLLPRPRAHEGDAALPATAASTAPAARTRIASG